MEYTISERLDKSTGGIHVDPVPDVTPNNFNSDCLATFIDDNGVTDDCENDSEKLDEVTEWVMIQIESQLADVIDNTPKLYERLRDRFRSSSNPAGAFSPYRLTVKILDHKFIQTQTVAIHCKFWFKIFR